MAVTFIPNIFGNIPDVVQDFLNNFTTEWGIFDKTGEPIAGFTSSLIGPIQSFYSLDYYKENLVANFPVQDGSFASYNKVEMPASPVVVLNFTGNLEERMQFLNMIDAACQSTNLYTILTPEIAYVDFTIESYNYTRSAAKGTTLISVELHLKEVRQVEVQKSTTGKKTTPSNDPTNANTQQNGKVQPQPASKQNESNFNNQTAGN
jgi:hypothetical protein